MMIDDNRELGQEREPGRDGRSSTGAVDFAYLRTQTLGDLELERDLLLLFVAQARRVVPSLTGLSPSAQADAAHLLKGSARTIGAFEAAALAGAYEADEGSRADAHLALVTAFDQAETAIGAYLARLSGRD